RCLASVKPSKRSSSKLHRRGQKLLLRTRKRKEARRRSRQSLRTEPSFVQRAEPPFRQCKVSRLPSCRFEHASLPQLVQTPVLQKATTNQGRNPKRADQVPMRWWAKCHNGTAVPTVALHRDRPADRQSEWKNVRHK